MQSDQNSERIILITGANSGIGKETTLALAQAGYRIIMACRNIEKSRQVQQEIISATKNDKVYLYPLDLASIASIKKFAETMKKDFPKLDILINNAGVFMMKRELTEDGFETTMGVNYLGTFLLTHLLLENLKASPRARIINVGSDAHYNGNINLDDFHFDKKFSGFKAYAASRLCTVFFTQELSSRLEAQNISVNSLHPGHVYTNIWNLWPKRKLLNNIMNFFMKRFAISAEEGARTSIYLADSSEVENISGKYFDKCQVKEAAEVCKDEGIQRALWDFTVRELDLHR